MAQEVDIKDFTLRDTTVKFKIYDVVYEAVPELPLGVMQQMSKLTNLTKQIEENGLESLLEIFDMFLLDESAALFRKNAVNKKQPIGVRHVMELLPWLLEEYGLRPTQPSSNSSTGLAGDETGITSTDGALPEALTL